MEIFKTVHGTKRVQVYRDEMPKDAHQFELVLSFLNVISIWSGYDQNETDFLSWEISEIVPDEIVKIALSRLGCKRR